MRNFIQHRVFALAAAVDDERAMGVPATAGVWRRPKTALAANWPAAESAKDLGHVWKAGCSRATMERIVREAPFAIVWESGSLAELNELLGRLHRPLTMFLHQGARLPPGDIVLDDVHLVGCMGSP